MGYCQHDPKQLDACLLNWVGQVCPDLHTIIAIDGKSVRGSGSSAKDVRAHSVTAYASLSELVLAQQRCEEKSNEITAIEALLPVLSLKGSLVTIDAMGTQVAIAHAITERGGDYLLVAKDNQPCLAQAVEDYMRIGKAHDWAHMKPSIFERLDKGPGHLETRHCVAVAAPDYLSELHRWPKLKRLVRYGGKIITNPIAYAAIVASVLAVHAASFAHEAKGANGAAAGHADGNSSAPPVDSK